MASHSNSNTPGANEIHNTEILTQCDHYAETILKITCDIRNQGFTSRVIPDFPKTSFLAMMDDTKKTRNALTGEELHNYLYSKLINLDTLTMPTSEAFTTLANLVNKLHEGLRILKNAHAKVFGCSLVYGQWLQMSFEYINNPSKKSGYRNNWKQRLSDNNICIKDRQARTLRSLAKKFYKYRRFHSLSIPVSEFWNKRKEIDTMLQNPRLLLTGWAMILRLLLPL